MKKTTRPQQTETSDRRLRLHRETVRRLDAGDLRQAWGGASNETVVRPSDACGSPTGGH
jgi:hypothetical protein